jgi:hypothetical protein
MKNGFEEIGRIAFKYYQAEKERIKARIDRAKARDSHKCLFVDREWGEDDTGDYAAFCYHRDGVFARDKLPLEEWCENCRYVQEFHLAYRNAAERTRKAKYQMTRRIRREELRQ